MRKKIILSAIFLGLAIFIFVPTNFANATLLTCGGDKTEADCTNAGGTVVNTGGCTSCSIVGTTCPAGMTKYANWTYYTRNSCGSVLHLCDSGNCGTVCIDTTTCNTPASNWLNSATAPSCTYYVDNYSSDTLPKGSLCINISNPCNYCVPSSSAYKTTCTDTPSAGCSTGTIKCSYFRRVARTCSSTKSNVACIGSGATPVAPTLNFSLSDGNLSATIIKGNSIILTWTVANATTCTASATPIDEEINWFGSQSYANGTYFSQPIIPVTIGTSTYNLQCFNTFSVPIQATALKTITIDVIDAIPPSCTDPSCGSDCGVIKKSYCMSGSNILPESDCIGGCNDKHCESCQWKETAP